MDDVIRDWPRVKRNARIGIPFLLLWMLLAILTGHVFFFGCAFGYTYRWMMYE